MTPTRQRALRELLRKYPDGMTTINVSKLSGFTPADTRRTLAAMPDAYVDRWVMGKRGQYMKVWCVVDVPSDCPHPKDRAYKYIPPKTEWRMYAATQAA